MIEQWYARHKVTGEIFRGAGGSCFDSINGLTKSIRRMNDITSHHYSAGMNVKICPPPNEWEFIKVVLA